MPIIIWGTRGLTSTVDSGSFFCPQCMGVRDYHLRQVRPFFTLYFIPLFPCGAAQRYVECTTCGGTFTEEVLDLRPEAADLLRGSDQEPAQQPREADMNRIYSGLQQGVSTEETEARLVDRGIPRSQAEALVDEMTGGKTWRCEWCGEHYLEGVKRCARCDG